MTDTDMQALEEALGQLQGCRMEGCCDGCAMQAQRIRDLFKHKDDLRKLTRIALEACEDEAQQRIPIAELCDTCKEKAGK